MRNLQKAEKQVTVSLEPPSLPFLLQRSGGLALEIKRFASNSNTTT
ncbi:hypothetical protein [Massilia sp. BJB1822]|nr:hypothetical protein [Massilia sp. BJB1822]